MSLRDLRRHVGRFAIVGFTGQSVPDDLRRLSAAFDLGGVIYFSRNVAEPAQLAELSKEVEGLARDWPLWISVDQEGGRVARLREPFTIWPAPRTLGRSGDTGLVERFARALAAELTAVGINLDFVPVLDVDTNPANPVIGDRALSAQAAEVARLGEAFISALQSAGVSACGKHFPGHGDTALDSHLALPVVEHERRRLEDVELVPFRRAIAAGVDTMMTAHLSVPALDPDHIATFSSAVVTGMLKEDLGFPGVVVSDDLGMKAVSASTGLPEATVAAIEAGCDVVLLCQSSADEQAEALEAVIHAAESRRLTTTRLDDAMARQRRLKAAMVQRAHRRQALDVVGSSAHQAVARDMAAWL